MGALRAAGLAIAAAAVMATPANGASIVVRLPQGFGAFAHPRATLAGSNVVYDDFSSRPRYELRIVSERGVDRRLLVFPRDTNGFLFKGSASQLAVLRPFGPDFQTTVGAELLAGPPRGPRATISSCALPSISGSNFDVDGDTIAYLDDGCARAPAERRLVVRDINAAAPAASPAIPSGVEVTNLALSGSYVAYHSQSAAGAGEIVEYDWRQGVEVMRVPDGGDGPCGSASESRPRVLTYCALAVQADGKVARLLGSFVYEPAISPREGPRVDDTCKGHIGWAGPDDPTWHEVVADACASEGIIHLAQDRVLFGALSTYTGQIAVADIQGGERRLGAVAWLYGFDGDHVLTEDASCTAMSVGSHSVLGDEPLLELRYLQDRLQLCPFRVSAAHLHLGRHPRLAFTVRCPKGCTGPVIIGTGDWLDAVSRNFTLEPGRSLRVRMALPRGSEILRHLHRARRVAISVYSFDVQSYQPREDPFSQVGRGDDPTARIRITLPPLRHLLTSARRAPRAASRSSR